jgi:hypothetical protein
MSDPRSLSSDGTVTADDAVTTIQSGEKISIQHLNGTTKTVTLDGIYGEKCNKVVIRWELAGAYDVNFETGQLTRKSVSLWRVTEQDMRRIRLTSQQMKQERQERIKEVRYGKRP